MVIPRSAHIAAPQMPYTVAVSFDTFYSNINLGGDPRATANTRRDDVVKTLERKFTVIEAFASGSIPRYTALKEHADLDVIVALHYGNHIEGKTPTQVLKSVRDALSEWRTGARRNGQAITLHYDSWPNVDIVPVSQSVDGNGNVTHYNVPNSNDDTWIMSRPKEHSKVIESKASECGKNFRRIITMMKHWNRVHSNLLQSYHIEVLAQRIFSTNIDDTPWHVFQFFSDSRSLLEGRLYYDTGYADDYLTLTNRREILKRIDTAIEKSRDAWHMTYGTNDDHKGAIEKWQQVFGSKFPNYG